MHCPTCRTDTLIAHRTKEADVSVDKCSRCSGIWFDRGELEKVLSTAARELRPTSDAKECERVCPRCRELMRRFHYPQTLVTVEVCPKCLGLWLDGGEIKEIHVVRERLRREGRMEQHAPVPGIKGKLLAWIDSTIESMKPY